MNRTNRIIRLASLIAVLIVVTGDCDRGATQKFLRDDPIAVVLDSQDASRVMPRDIDLAYDALENLFAKPGDSTSNVRAQSVNTIDEVPDSSWFTNRMGATPMTIDALLKGPDTTTGPAPGKWTVVAAKGNGVTPGFTVRDSTGQVWFIKFDPPGYRAMATGTEIVVTKLMWALGYHVPEVHLAPGSGAADDWRPGEHLAQWTKAAIATFRHQLSTASGASGSGRLLTRHRQ
jgi:hypothetical protein